MVYALAVIIGEGSDENLTGTHHYKTRILQFSVKFGCAYLLLVDVKPGDCHWSLGTGTALLGTMSFEVRIKH